MWKPLGGIHDGHAASSRYKGHVRKFEALHGLQRRDAAHLPRRPCLFSNTPRFRLQARKEEQEVHQGQFPHFPADIWENICNRLTTEEVAGAISRAAGLFMGETAHL